MIWIVIACAAVIVYGLSAYRLARETRFEPEKMRYRARAPFWMALASGLVAIAASVVAFGSLLAVDWGGAGTPPIVVVIVVVVIAAMYLFLVHPLVRVLLALRRGPRKAHDEPGAS